MTYLDAAVEVLRTARRPLTTREVSEAALRSRLIEPVGKTPDATMSAALYRHVRDAPHPLLRRAFTQGPARAVRGTVYWCYVR